MKKITRQNINDYLLGGIMMNGILAVAIIIVFSLIYLLADINYFEDSSLTIALQLNITLQIIAICVKGYIKEEEKEDEI
jgi:hypothetical protein